MDQVQYLPYKLGFVCQHGSTRANTNYIDVVCSIQNNIYHRISQAGKICNKCAALIMSCVNSVPDCPCCSEKLQALMNQSWICTHARRQIDQITIKCIGNIKNYHQVPFRQKVCQNCYNKIRAAFMFAQSCVVCDEKQGQLFQNLEKTITKPSFYYFDFIINQMKKQKLGKNQIKQQIQNFCLAEPRQQTNSKYSNQAIEIGQNLPQYHQSKRYQLYPKCQEHRQDHLDLCNNCLVSLLNLNCCPYGCSYEKKQTKNLKPVPALISQSGFLCLYPKKTKDYLYLEYFNVKHVQQVGKLDKWQGSLKRIKYSSPNNIQSLFSLYGSAVQVSKHSYLFSGGLRGQNLSNLKTSNHSFLIKISQNTKNFDVQNFQSMNQQRCSHGLVSYQNILLVIGGFNHQKSKFLSTCQKYNFNTKKWQIIAEMRVPRSKPNVFQFKGIIYVMGGISNNQNIWNSQCERYDLAKNIWKQIQYKGFDVPFITGATSITRAWGIGQVQNLILIGGSNYETSTYLLQQAVFGEDNFKMNPSGIEQKMYFNRQSPSISLMKTENDKQSILIVFGGLEQHESLLSIDAVRLKKNNNQLTPFFVYDNVNLGSYRLLLRQNSLETYEYMMNKLIQQGLLNKSKLGENQQNLLKKESTLHLIEKMWYGIGKCTVGFNGY